MTLIELGVVIAVISVLTAVVGVGSRGMLRAARSERTAKEMTRLSASAQNVAFRGTTFRTGCTNAADCPTAEMVKQFNGAPIPAAPAALCYDLAGTGWGGAAAPTADMTAVMGGRINAYGRPYAMCIQSRRVSVLTCMPAQDVPVDLSGAAPAGCAMPGFTFACGAGEQCVLVDTALTPPRAARLAHAYKFLYWGEATVPIPP